MKGPGGDEFQGFGVEIWVSLVEYFEIRGVALVVDKAAHGDVDSGFPV